MATMNAVARWVVNHLKGRRNARLYAWVHDQRVMPPGSVCLEVGCGNGNMAARIVRGMGPARFVATDVDPRQLEAARRYLAREFPAGLPRELELRPADMLELPFPDRAFDTVFAFATLHHAGETHGDASRLPTALGEIDRVLRPGGFLAYQEFLHTQLLRDWLHEHGYRSVAERHRGRWESSVVVKPNPPATA